MTCSYDLVVIGGGAGGLVAAREGRRRGASTVIVQDGAVGGDCTFTGCVPSKALLAAAAAGIGFDDAMIRVHRAIERIAASEDTRALAAEDIDVIDGFARFTSPTPRWRSTGSRSARIGSSWRPAPGLLCQQSLACASRHR